jgi:hypothetical protein
MKKLLKKATMLLCAMIVAIGFVGGTVEEASAASKLYLDKNYTVRVNVSGLATTNGTLTINSGQSSYSFKVKGGNIVFGSKTKDRINIKAANKNTQNSIWFTFKTDSLHSLSSNLGDGSASNYIFISASKLKSKNAFKVNIKKKNGKFVLDAQATIL